MGDSHRTGPHRRPWYRRKLAREIVAVLAFKVFALVFLYLAFFRADERVHVDPRVGPPFLSSTPTASEENGGDV